MIRHTQHVERCTGDHAHVAIQFVYYPTHAYLIVTTNEADTLKIATAAMMDPEVTHVMGGDYLVPLN